MEDQIKHILELCRAGGVKYQLSLDLIENALKEIVLDAKKEQTKEIIENHLKK